MSKVRSVALCDESAKLMEQKSNFSAWVREALLRENALLTGVHTGSRKEDEGGILCNPLASKLCSVCWPYGKPQPADWRFYHTNYKLHDSTSYQLENPGIENEYDEKWIQLRARENNPQNQSPETPPKQNLKNKNSKKRSVKHLGVLRRIFRALW